MNKYDFAVVGNGAIGTLAAIKLKQANPNKSVVLVGNFKRRDSASVAAGAMIAVFAEMEECAPEQEEMQNRYLKIGKESSLSWRSFLSQSGGLGVITAEDTLVFLKKAYSQFEFGNFNAVKRVLPPENQTGNETELNWLVEKKNIEEVINIKGEFAICPTALFKHFDILLENLGIYIISEDALKVDLETNIVKFDNSELDFQYIKLVLAAGSQTARILKPESILPMLQGVGTAISINNNADISALSTHVIRTVNRGGAQCGMHVVPRSDGTIYLGAGNFVSHPGPASHRLDTISYLLSTLESDLLNRRIVYNFSGNLLMGMRPRSIDGFPMIGSIAKYSNVFIATATNRLGLTWAPRIADQINLWASGKSLDSEFIDWNPDRIPLNFGTQDSAIEYYVSSRISNACEHGLSGSGEDDLSRLRSEFTAVAHNLVGRIRKRYPQYEGVVLHPDNWAALLTDVPISE